MRPNIPPDQFAGWLKQLSAETIQAGNEQERKQTEQSYKKFVSYFKIGKCSICSKPLKTFSANSPCLHWLLRPKCFKKKQFPSLYKKFTYFRISAYVRWVASIDNPIRNINDIEDEHPDGKLIDFTAKYKYITWSFSCGKSDFEGHNNSAYGNLPHYHMQMKLNGNSFIDYGDFHIPFHEDDLYDIELFTHHSDTVRHGLGHGVGMNEMLKHEEMLEYIVENSEPTENEEEAAFDMDTLISADEGTTISGELLAECIAEAKEKGQSIASVVRKKIKNASITTIVSAGKGVPEAMPRKSKKKLKRTDNQ
jgi:hypothetical protein